MDLFSHPCSCCTSTEIRTHIRYQTKAHGSRTIYHCRKCDIYFSETFATPIAGLTTPLSQIIEIIKTRSEGMSLNATARTFNVSKKSVIDWERRLADLKPILLLYSLLHEFIHQEIEGDELYTKVEKNVLPTLSEGWTIVLMERGSRFLWELHCGRKDQQLFEQALKCLAEVIEQTHNLSLLTDGERRYGNLLFEICHEVIRNGKPGRPQKLLPKGVRVRLKTKATKSVQVVAVKSIKHLYLSILKPSMTFPNPVSMITMSKPLMLRLDDVILLFGAKLTPMLNPETVYKGLWMFTG